MKKRFCVLVAASVLVLASCADMTSGQRQLGGAVIGAGVGGVLGNQFGHGKGGTLMTLLGVAGGALAGSYLAQQMAPSDHHYVNRAYGYAFDPRAPVGEPYGWENPATGNRGTVTPIRQYTAGAEYCREYQQTIIIGGHVEEGYGTACRQPDGSWQIRPR